MKLKMNFGKVTLYGFLIWVILFFIGWLFIVVLPSLMNIFMLVIGIILIYLFSRVIIKDIKENQILVVGIIWFVMNFLLDLIFIVFLLKNSTYYSIWSIWLFYGLLIFEPLIVKSLSK